MSNDSMLIKNLLNEIHNPIFFTVCGTQDESYNGQIQPKEITFDKIIQQEGDAFDVSINTFTVPVSGLWYICAQANFETHNHMDSSPLTFGISSTNWEYIYSVKNDNWVPSLPQNGVNWAPVFINTTLNLEAGTKIKVKYDFVNHGDIKGNSKLFSATLIQKI